HFLRKWLREHIMGTDKKYTGFFLEKGLKGSWNKRSWIGKIWDSVYSK
ncbi:MAG TPA: hemerythrin, partial [Candidatus Competibacteraceae bacterium]|nr:hemerythrin [Candidatus Competibacteraceae bacterium]